MLDSVPVPFQAILYPLAGAAIILVVGRFLPGWIRRLLAVVAVGASLAALWSLRSGGGERVEIFWEPLNLFRMGPVLYADGLSLLAGLTLAWVTAAIALGIRAPEPRRASWRGLILVTLAGCLMVTMAANLLTLALGSALVDLALIALALLTVESSDGGSGTPLGAVVPGVASTLLLFLSALRMEAQAGHASLLARELPAEGLVLVGVAGVLRLLVFPLHPRGWNTPQSAAVLLLPVGVGIYLLGRIQTLVPMSAIQPWMMTVGAMALVAGGLLAWSGSRRPRERRIWAEMAEFWPGALVHQTGYALVFVILLGETVLWPLLSLTCTLGVLAIWWDGLLEHEALPRPRWVAWIAKWIEPRREKARSYVAAHLPIVERWLNSPWLQVGTTLLVVLALASLAGAPATIGAQGRWPFYATLLKEGDSSLLLVLAADTFLAAGLWTFLGIVLKRTGDQRPRLATLLAMIALAVPVIALGIAPGSLGDGVDLAPIARPQVSVWGLGLTFALPWLFGAWLARVGAHLETHFAAVYRFLSLNWLYRAGAWVGQRLVGAVYWLGQVGEGAGWWGWALIILALGTIVLTSG